MTQNITPTDEELADETPEAVESVESGAKVVMPDIYAEQPAATQPLLKILDPDSPDIDSSTGFNPYDTAVFLKKPELKPR